MVTRKSIDAVITQLQSWVNDKAAQLEREESRDYPSEDRIELIEGQLEALEGALEALQNYEF